MKELTEKELRQVKTPCYVLDTLALEGNLKVLEDIHNRTGAHVLQALKGFAPVDLACLCMHYLQGTAVGSVSELNLSMEKYHGIIHSYTPAYDARTFNLLRRYSDYITFNSITQMEKFCPVSTGKDCVSYGLRINLEYSEVSTPMYDTSSALSRLGATLAEYESVPDIGKRIDGLHIHNMCQSDSYALERSLDVLEDKFGQYLHGLRWVNLGGGHHITAKGYDKEHLVKILNKFRAKYKVQLILELGESVGLGAGMLVSKVLDVSKGTPKKVILDTSAAAHMPDVLEMPYVPDVVGRLESDKGVKHILGGISCLAGDVIGEYTFYKVLVEGDLIQFTDMAAYTMVKNTTFNGIDLPSIYVRGRDDEPLRCIKEFSYIDYKARLG